MEFCNGVPIHAVVSVTLPQLLAVCAYVGVLFLVSVPSLRSISNVSRHAQCMERLGKIAQASQIYSMQDINEMAIPIHPAHSDPQFDRPLGAYEWGGKSGIGTEHSTQHALASWYGTERGFGPATRPLNDILYPQGFRDFGRNGPEGYNPSGAANDTRLALDIYHCPADDGPLPAGNCWHWVQKPGRSSYDHFDTSYVANVYSNEFSGTVFSNSPYLRRRSNVPNPARTIHYQESIGRWAWAARRVPDGCNYCCIEGISPGPTGAIPGWHGRDWTVNQSFIDGHVEKLQFYVNDTEDESEQAIHREPEVLDSCPTIQCCAIGDQECATALNTDDPNHCDWGYRCALVRGDGWQIDTLPAPGICMGRRYYYGYRPSHEACVAPPNQTAGSEEPFHGIR